jgi:hypothetical protein
MTVLTNFTLGGWYEIISEGQVTLYLSAVDEGMITGPSDTPANKAFRPRVLNPDTFSIKRSPQVWVWGSSGVQGAAFGQLQLDNYDGAFNALLANDFRGSVVTIKLVAAAALLTGTEMNDAPTVCTGIIDSVVGDQFTVTISIKDTIARLDKSLPVRYNPPFVDSGAANSMIPLTFGAVRNRAPLLIDTPNRIYQIHDRPIPNLTLASDKAAPLDPHANPPQYVPALSGSGIQPATMPIGKFVVDCSSYGTQSVIPGADDVLAGSGAFLGTWIGSPAVPPGWTWTNNTGSSIDERLNYFGSGTNAASLITASIWQPGFAYGDSLSFPSILLGGYSYRLNFSVYGLSAAKSIDGSLTGGLVVATALSVNPADYLSGYKTPITSPNGPFVKQNFSYEFTVPAGSTRTLYFIMTTSSGNTAGQPNGVAGGAIYNITLEQLGQYQELPLSGIPGDHYFTEILVERAGEDSSIFNSTEAAALTDDGNGGVIPMGVSFDQPPNILDALRMMTDTRGATIFTDHLGVLRTRFLLDPTDPGGTVICDFDTTNCQLTSITTDEAKGLTTLFGARANQSVFSDSDFVTDQSIVPQSIKTRFTRKSQFQRTASASPAGQYSSAVDAPIFDTIHDDAEFCQDDADGIVGIYAAKIYSDGSSTNGKRRFITLDTWFDDYEAIGRTVTCSVNDLIFGEQIRFTATNGDGSENFVDQLGRIVDWDPKPFGKGVTLIVHV